MLVAGSTNILEGQGIGRPTLASAEVQIVSVSRGKPHFLAAGALPDTYWARELDVDFEEWNTYLRSGVFAFLDAFCNTQFSWTKRLFYSAFLFS